MRLMLDTNVVIYYVGDQDSLTKDVKSLISDYDNQLYMSMESIRELIVAYRVKKILQQLWKSPQEMVDSIEKSTDIDILPVDMNVMHTLANLQLNTAQDHKDPSDHVIISHAITLGMPLISSDRKFPFYKKQGLDLIENF